MCRREGSKLRGGKKEKGAFSSITRKKRIPDYHLKGKNAAPFFSSRESRRRRKVYYAGAARDQPLPSRGKRTVS